MIPQRQDGRSSIVLLVAVVVAGALSLGVWVGQRQGGESWQSAVFYPAPRPIAPFELVGADGAAFANADLEGAWDLLFFGFTHCPDVCPNTLTVLRQVNERLRDRGLTPPRVTLISVDPERDRPAAMARYVAFFDPAFRAATGAPDALAALSLDLGVAYYIELHEPGDLDYAVDHGASVFIVDPDGRLRGQLRPPPDPEAFAGDLARLLAG